VAILILLVRVLLCSPSMDQVALFLWIQTPINARSVFISSFFYCYNIVNDDDSNGNNNNNSNRSNNIYYYYFIDFVFFIFYLFI
jgi:hypothetical protein